MKKLLIIMCSLFFHSNIFASQNLVMCPLTLTCNYTAGTCSLPKGNWYFSLGDIGDPVFTTINLYSISVEVHYNKSNEKRLSLDCNYVYTSNGFKQNFDIIASVKKLTGIGWVFSGFGNDISVCQPSISDPAACAAEQ